MYKPERDWADLSRADKTVLFIGIFMWMLISFGVGHQTKKCADVKQHIIQSELFHQR